MNMIILMTAEQKELAFKLFLIEDGLTRNNVRLWLTHKDVAPVLGNVPIDQIIRTAHQEARRLNKKIGCTVY